MPFVRFVNKRDFDCKQVEQQTCQIGMLKTDNLNKQNWNVFRLFDFPKSRLININ